MGSALGASGFAGGSGGGTTAAVCCGFSFASVGGLSALAGLSVAVGASPFGRSVSLASGLPRSSDASLPCGGCGLGLDCGFCGSVFGGGGGSRTSCTGIGVTSAGGDIGQSISSSSGSRCSTSEPIGPRNRTHHPLGSSAVGAGSG